MGKSRKRFNEKAREQKETIVDNSSLNNVSLRLLFFIAVNIKIVQFLMSTFFLQIKLDLPEHENGEYKTTAGENALVLPSQKRQTKFKKTENVTRILSKKQRKKLEKIVEKKKKKEQVSLILKIKS